MSISTLFQTTYLSDEYLEVATRDIEGRLTEESLLTINIPFSAKEVKKAVSDMGATKTPGHNGFHALFYQEY